MEPFGGFGVSFWVSGVWAYVVTSLDFGYPFLGTPNMRGPP